MRSFIRFLVFPVFMVACSPASKKLEKDCVSIIDKAAGSLQKYEFNRDSSQLDTALAFYDEAILCDPSNTEGHLNKIKVLAMLGRYRESLVVIKNAYKVHDVSESAHAHLLMIQGILHERIGSKDSGSYYFRESIAAYDQLVKEHPEDSAELNSVKKKILKEL
jgi:tetratricopeptide (TPR) repeat protein